MLREQARRTRVGWQLARFGARRLPSWWATARSTRGRGIRVWYGRDRLPRLDEVAYGGIVKFQHLATELPNRPRDFTVLYLGSSSIPLDAQVLVRLARRRGAPFAWNQNGVAYRAWAGDAAERLNRPAARLLHQADHVFFQSAFCKLGADRFYGERRGPWEILHNPVDTRVFTPGPAVERPLTLLLGGTQYQRYRLESALRVLALLPEARLLVSGRLSYAPDAEADARALVASLGLAERVELTGPFTQAEAPALYHRADLLLHTKLMDPCPNVVLEAMASGLPVVYADNGGTPELVGPDAGVGVPAPLDWEVDRPPAPEELADAVRRAAADREALGGAARARAVATFDLQPWIERHLAVFGELVRSDDA
jgi:glycosyltransferase involved in cell wall biosynthesis